jgi:ligand-binding sensor domain-containing protein/two-component sensor histidine kinase
MPDYHVQMLDENSGLRSYEIRGISRDMDGFLWVLYNDRVQRYDGREIKNFTIGENPISILCDQDNHIWVTTQKQVLRFSNDHAGFKTLVTPDTTNNNFGCIFRMPGSRKLFLQSSNGVYCYDSAHDRFTPFYSGLKKIYTSNRALSYAEHTVFFCGRDSIYSLNIDTKELKSFHAEAVFSIQAIGDNKLLASDWNFHTYLFDLSTGKAAGINSSGFPGSRDSFFRMNYAIPLDADRYLVSSQKGLFQFSASSGSFKPLHFYYRGRPVHVQATYAMYTDAQQTIWMGFDGGILFFSPGNENIGLLRSGENKAGEKDWDNNVRNFAEDEDGNLWFVTADGFDHWNLQTGEINSYPEKNTGESNTIFPSIRGLAYDGKNVLLGPTNLGPKIYDPHTGKYSIPIYDADSEGRRVKAKIEGDFINRITALHTGNYVIAARDGLYALEGKTYRLREIKTAVGRVLFSNEDKEHRVWVATDRGLICFDSLFHVLFTVPLQGEKNIFHSLYEIGPNEFLLGAKGLYLLSVTGNTFHIQKENAFFDQSVISFLFKDSLDRCWVGSDNGLFLYNRAVGKIQSFDFSDNLQGLGFSNEGIFHSSKGVLYIGGLNGINYFRPEAMQVQEEKLNVSIINMKINEDDSSYLTGDLPAKLDHRQNSLRFEFVAPYFKNANRIKYRYRLDGLYAGWVDNGNDNSVFFTSLPPGSYTFRASASLNGTDWFESKSISFVIRPPFWSTWWFYLLCFFIVAAILYLLYRFRIKQMMHVQSVRNRISAELHDDIGSKLTNINILTMLTRQNMDDPPQAKAHLERISDEVQTSAEALDDIVWSINNRNDSVEEIIARMRRYAAEVLSAERMKFNIRVPDDMQHIKFPMEKKHDMYLLFKEIINNIHKHAGATEVLLELLISPDKLEMHIRDDGRGFDSNIPAEGNGLLNLKERTEKWHGDFNLVSSPGNGAEISIRIPLRSSNAKR